MRLCLMSACLTLALIVIASPQAIEAQEITASAPGNLLFSPDVPTVWHKLGIPQGVGRYKKYRESRINRKGKHPEWEKKPKLVKLTDAANLAPDAPKMLQAAAEIKKAEDLAPQKLKALKYLGTIGCGCYSKKNAGLVENALLEALDDCTADVRKEALMVVMNQVSGQCSCSCESTCNSKSCCSEKIYKKLEAMANKTDDTGCPLETDPAIRALATQALNACPFPRTKPDDEPEVTQEPKPKKLDSATESGDAATEPSEESGFDGDDIGETKEDAEKRKKKKNSILRDDESTYYDQSRRTTWPASFRSGSNQSVNADLQLMKKLEITGVVRSVRTEKGNATIVFDELFEFPKGLKVVIASDLNHVSYGSVEITKAGTAVIQIEDASVLKHLQQMQSVRLGVFE